MAIAYSIWFVIAEGILVYLIFKVAIDTYKETLK